MGDEYKGYELPPLIQGKLVKRYKRFLADVTLKDGTVVTAHCPNSGSMKGCAQAGAPVWMSKSDNPKRKLKYTWELIQTKTSYVGVNTQVPNKLVKQAIESGQVAELAHYTKVTAEVKTSAHTRLDLMLEQENKKRCYVEIKNCTLVEAGLASFPDAVTTRGQKHLDELVALHEQGHDTVIFYLIQRMDAKTFTPAANIDPVYAKKLVWAAEKGVQVITRDVDIDPHGEPGHIRLRRPVPVALDYGSFFNA